ncbi:MAG: hypothetical protein J1F02_12110, partial [Lachnospiraceae bacterium]|nr:hypothetical protein [Lachnospiraceae bacterium]
EHDLAKVGAAGSSPVSRFFVEKFPWSHAFNRHHGGFGLDPFFCLLYNKNVIDTGNPKMKYKMEWRILWN